MKKLLAVLVLFGITAAIVGCEAKGKVDDNGVKAKVDTKDLRTLLRHPAGPRRDDRCVVAGRASPRPRIYVVPHTRQGSHTDARALPLRAPGQEVCMLTILLIVLLLMVVVGVSPAWPYSRDWGYYPSGAATIVLLLVIILLFSRGI